MQVDDYPVDDQAKARSNQLLDNTASLIPPVNSTVPYFHANVLVFYINRRYMVQDIINMYLRLLSNNHVQSANITVEGFIWHSSLARTVFQASLRTGN